MFDMFITFDRNNELVDGKSRNGNLCEECLELLWYISSHRVTLSLFEHKFSNIWLLISGRPGHRADVNHGAADIKARPLKTRHVSP